MLPRWGTGATLLSAEVGEGWGQLSCRPSCCTFKSCNYTSYSILAFPGGHFSRGSDATWLPICLFSSQHRIPLACVLVRYESRLSWEWQRKPERGYETEGHAGMQEADETKGRHTNMQTPQLSVSTNIRWRLVNWTTGQSHLHASSQTISSVLKIKYINQTSYLHLSWFIGLSIYYKNFCLFLR